MTCLSGEFSSRPPRLHEIRARDPFVSLVVEGAGQFIELAAERGRVARPDLKLGICGEHGGDPASIAIEAQNLYLS